MLSNQLGHACSKITVVIQRKVHCLYTKNLPTELPGYTALFSGEGRISKLFPRYNLKAIHLERLAIATYRNYVGWHRYLSLSFSGAISALNDDASDHVGVLKSGPMHPFNILDKLSDDVI